MKTAYRFRGLLMLPPMVFVTLCTWGEVENEWVIFGVGGVVFALGVALRLWAQLHLRYRLNTRTVLTTTGPYAHVRNPMHHLAPVWGRRTQSVVAKLKKCQRNPVVRESSGWRHGGLQPV